MRIAALILAAGLSAGLAGAAFAQPAPQGAPPPGYGGPDQGPPPAYGGPQQGPPPGAAMPPSEQGPPGGGGAPHGIREKFEAANVTHDGRLTEQQAEAGGLKSIAHHFHEIDRDGKGYVTMQDVHAWHKARHAAKQAQGSAGGAPPAGAPPGQEPY